MIIFIIFFLNMKTQRTLSSINMPELSTSCELWVCNCSSRIRPKHINCCYFQMQFLNKLVRFFQEILEGGWYASLYLGIRQWRTPSCAYMEQNKNSLCQRLGFVLFTDKAASAEGVRNEHFSVSKVCFVFTLVPSGTVAPSSFSGILQIHGLWHRLNKNNDVKSMKFLFVLKHWLTCTHT